MDISVIIAAVVQAMAAGIIAVFTVRLARSTSDYVEEMRRANELQAEANRLARAVGAVAMGEAAPLLVVAVNGRNSDTTTFVEGVLVVENSGGGPASDVVVTTDWGEAPLKKQVLKPGERADAGVTIDWQDWTKGTNPKPLTIRYRDAQGEVHEEPVGGDE